MSLKVNSNNSLSLPLLKVKLENKILGKRENSELPKTPLSQINPGLNKDTILQLQELQDHSANLLARQAPQAPEKPEKINLDKEINLNDTPRLSWLIGRDDNLYNSYVSRLSNGAETMKDFSIIIEKTKDSKFIPVAVQRFLQEHIQSFQHGYKSQQKARDATDDPIVHKVIDYVMPKTQARLQLLQDYLASKELDPKYGYEPADTDFTLKEVSIKSSLTSGVSFIGNAGSDTDYSKKLLEFLAKDLRWYEWYLRDDASEPLESLMLTRTSSLVGLIQPRVEINLPIAAPAA